VLLNILILINKRKLESMILAKDDYSEILKQSQKLDVLIVRKFRIMNRAILG